MKHETLHLSTFVSLISTEVPKALFPFHFLDPFLLFSTTDGSHPPIAPRILGHGNVPIFVPISTLLIIAVMGSFLTWSHSGVLYNAIGLPTFF